MNERIPSISTIHEKFVSRAIEIETLHSASTAAAKSAFKNVENTKAYLKKNPDHWLKDFKGGQNMFYKDLITGRTVPYGQVRQGLENKPRETQKILNRQLQWLIAELFEEFEILLLNYYARFCMIDPELWKFENPENLETCELQRKPLNYFLSAIKKSRRRDASKILDIFCLNFRDLKNVETKNGVGVNIKLLLKLVEKIRHVVVHRNGIIDCYEVFEKELLESMGLWNGGNPSSKNQSLIGYFFGKSEDFENSIVLLPTPHPDIPFAQTSSFNIFCSRVVGYAFFLKELFEKGRPPHGNSLTKRE